MSRVGKSIFDDSRARREVKELQDLVGEKRKSSLKLLKEIDRTIEKQFYDEFKLLDPSLPINNFLSIIEEKDEDNHEDNHEDLELQEQQWFSTQLEWTRKVTERKGATHRYIKDPRPSSSIEPKEKKSTNFGQRYKSTTEKA